ncbi:fas-binding factor 1 homolog isoform X1 [Gadus macrocephalus]|uniref:fas-binding factor 1 homolog isoform X1 n=1 Tax=Gadus macrocephalus TaxID=80720 RepID=UPI0028CBBC29|nr:fas-binding factor 1 homolog isoform X1 [Gadus macrocephalus]
MAFKSKSRLLLGSFEEKLSDTDYSEQGKPKRAASLNRSSKSDDFFQKLAEEAEREAGVEDSDVSEADPTDILKNLKDMDDMEADLFGAKKPGSAPPQAKRSSPPGARAESTARAGGAGSTSEPKKPSSAPSASSSQGYRKFNFSDLDDPLIDLLDELDLEETKSEPSKVPPKKPVPSPTGTPVLKTKEPAKVVKKGEELTFDDDEDDLIDALGFDNDKEIPKKKEASPLKSSSDPPQRARTRLDEILGRGTPPRLLERPPTGERKEEAPQPMSRQDRDKPGSAKEPLLEDDLGFGSYQPTLGSAPEGRQSRRQSVRFSTEDISSSTLERKAKPSAKPTTPNPAPTTPNPAPTTTNPATSPSRARSSSDWLGLKPSDELTFLDDDEPVVTDTTWDPTSPAAGRRNSPNSTNEKDGTAMPRDPAPSPAHFPTKGPKTEEGRSQKGRAEEVDQEEEEQEEEKLKKNEEEEDWLSGALSRRKALGASQPERRRSRQEESLGLGGGEEVVSSTVGKPAPSPAPSARRQETEENSSSLLTSRMPSPGVHSKAVRDVAPTQGTQPTPSPAPALQPQVTPSTESLQQLLLQQQQLMQSQFLGLGGALDYGCLVKPDRAEPHLGDRQALQARIAHLEGQVRGLLLERDQTQMLMENVRLRHQQDMEQLETAHRARVQLLEASWSQREARAWQESKDLAESMAAAGRTAEQQRAELTAAHQRRLAQSQQDRDREVQRLRDLQRQSILEVKQDHEEQLLRLKRLKEEEIEAVTSATSQTRSLTGVMEQMEGFSCRLGELSCRVESTHEHTAQGLEQGARQREEQLRVMQERLGQQQRAMAEERARLKEVITRMEVQLGEQQRQLEKERWRVTAEQAKAESSQRSLEEERRALNQHTSMEREELERAKNALLEEQQAVMTRCGEERRKMAAEWAQLHAAEKTRQEQEERRAGRHLERDAHAHSNIISIAQEQAEVKLRSGELQQREGALAREREALERQLEEAQREKERLSATALKLQARAQEVEAFSKLATEKFEEGERALQTARGVESEHQARLRSIHSQIERLRQQEEQLLQERVRMTDLRTGEERFRQSYRPLASHPNTGPPGHADFSAMWPSPATPELVVVPASPQPSRYGLQASLALLRHTAEKDRDFLQDEQFFLETLKKGALQSLFHTQ